MPDYPEMECMGVGCDFTTISPSELQNHTIDDHYKPDLEDRPEVIIPDGGTCSVHFQMDILRAVTPQDAVGQVLAHIFNEGLHNMHFRVTAGDDTWLVRGRDHVLDEDEISISLGRQLTVETRSV